MPRKGRITLNLNPVPEATNDDIIAAIAVNQEKLTTLSDDMDRVNHTLLRTHLGHEAYLWEEEVEDVD